uniref:Uncharacterized protein n=1 Tax=Astyanax mexicanus TaxID=7994 RepID=A0A8B9LA37_ASTMX
MPVEQEKPQQVYDKSGHADPHHHPRVLDLVGVRVALHGLQQDGEAERRQEHGVDQRAHDLGSDPAERVLAGGLGLLGEAHGHQGHGERDNIAQHVEGVGEHRQRRGDPAHHQLHDEEAESQAEHAEQAPVFLTQSHLQQLQPRNNNSNNKKRLKNELVL